MAAVAARDLDAVLACIADGATTVHHMTGAVQDEHESRRGWELILAGEGLRASCELLATLGDSLALHRGRIAFEGIADGALSFGAGFVDAILLVEVDARGLRVQGEFFAPDRLGDALVRLYERHAELLPDGHARRRAATTARSVAALAALPDVERLAAVLAPDVEWVDSRNVGAGSIPGAEALLESIRALIALASDFAVRIDDVICARPDALLVRWTNSGTLRAGGGSFERDLCHLWLFAADGLLIRWEQFDGSRADEALARFDALTAEAPLVRRRVRPNAATANAARLDAAVGARDIDAMYATFADGATGLHHPTGAAYQERESRRSYEIMLATEALRFEHEPLATLGDSLALCLGHVSFDATANPVGSFGASNMDSILFVEVDGRGQRVLTEFFATDRLGDAVARLYGRYAELLPGGPERLRATATARSVAALTALFDPAALGAILAPDAEYADRRPLGFPTLRGAGAIRSWIATLSESAVDVAFRLDDVFDLQPDRLVARWTNFGTQRLGGGSFERPFVSLNMFGPDGLLLRWEHFATDREAFARVDEIAAEPLPARFANAAARTQGDLVRSWREGRVEGVVASLAPDFVLDDRRSVVGLRLSGDDFVTNLRVLSGAQSSEWSNELLATRGERLALLHVRFAGVSNRGGEFLEEHLSVFESDASGRWLAVVVFDLDQRDAATAELEARYAAGEGAGDSRAALVRSFGSAFAARNWDGLAALLTQDLVVHDHRLLGWEALHGAAAYVAALRSLVELAPDTQLRIDHVVLSERGILCVASWVGTHEGGPFEAPSVFVTELDTQGRIRRLDQYDSGQLDAARARLAELSAVPGTPTIENAATRMWEQVDAAWHARSWTRFAALHPPGFRLSDRRKLLQRELDRDEHLARMRAFFAMDSSLRSTVLATRGNRLALIRTAGPSEIEFLAVVEVDGGGSPSAMVMLDPDDLDAAYAVLDERFTAGEGAGSVGWAEQRAWIENFAHRDWEALASRYPPDLKVHDHRALGWGEVSGAAYIDLLRSLVELAPDVRLRLDHFVGRGRGALTLAEMIGTRDGGAFELARLVVRELDESGRPRRLDHYDLDQLDQARARFEDASPRPAPHPAERGDPGDGSLRRILRGGGLERPRGPLRAVISVRRPPARHARQRRSRHVPRERPHDRLRRIAPVTHTARDLWRPAGARARALDEREARNGDRGARAHRGGSRRSDRRDDRVRPRRPPRGQPRACSSATPRSDALELDGGVAARVHARAARPRPRARARGAARTTSSSTTTAARAPAASTGATATSLRSRRSSSSRPTASSRDALLPRHGEHGELAVGRIVRHARATAAPSSRSSSASALRAGERRGHGAVRARGPRARPRALRGAARPIRCASRRTRRRAASDRSERARRGERLGRRCGSCARRR